MANLRSGRIKSRQNSVKNDRISIWELVGKNSAKIQKFSVLLLCYAVRPKWWGQKSPNVIKIAQKSARSYLICSLLS